MGITANLPKFLIIISKCLIFEILNFLNVLPFFKTINQTRPDKKYSVTFHDFEGSHLFPRPSWSCILRQPLVAINCEVVWIAQSCPLVEISWVDVWVA